MMDSQIKSFQDVLLEIDEMPWNFALYLGDDYPWHADTPCAVLDPSEVDRPSEIPEFAKSHNLKYALNVQTAQDILENLRQQRSAPRIEELIDAFNFYYKNDAFLQL